VRHARRYGWITLAAASLLTAWLGSGFYVVEADERGVIRQFGDVVAQVGPGMHYRLPWPITQVDVLKTTSVMKTGAGFALPGGESEAVTGVELLTGDTNIISLALILQYVIRDPSDFLFRIEKPRVFIGALAQSVLAETVLGMSVDEVLTTGRLAIQERVRVQTQVVLDRYRSGIQIISANIMAIALDRSVAPAFQEVADAMADREKIRNEARAYANSVIPKARGEARASVSDGQNYKRQRVAEAIGDTDRFLALLSEYEKAPDVSRTRIYLETIEKVLPKAKMHAIDSQNGHVPLSLRVTTAP
jgi:membrane protease subunit HflK